ncbi:MAG: tetratricopeptide repeat protein [Planctomycetota bacterium]|jgi:tetratricopeptide (TPR) repeat protein
MSNQATKHPATTRANRGSLDREAAARLLRDARSKDADDAVEWAYLTIPECLGARRLKIRMLLRQGNLEAADALIAQGLLQQPTNASLSYLRARSLFAQGKLEPAGRELRLVLAQRPRHRGALELAGRVARGLGDARRAVALLERAERRRPDDQIRSLLVEAWLDGGRPNMARKVLRRMAAPTALLRAGVFRSAGRLLEARELLEQAAADPTAADHTDVMTQLIDLLERTSDLQRLRRVLEPVDTDRPAVLARAGMAWLAMGAFHTAAVHMSKLARVRGFRAQALLVLMVAAAMVNRTRLADRALERLRRIAEPISPRTVAEAWGRGLLGRLLLDQCSARKAGADPHTGRLRQLLQDASGVFEGALASEGSPSKRQRRHLQRHLAVCRQVSAQADDDVADSPAPYSAGETRRAA